MAWKGRGRGPHVETQADPGVHFLRHTLAENGEADRLTGRAVVRDTTDELSATLGGEAMAGGTATAASADVELTVRDLGAVSVVTGTATVAATAGGATGAGIFAAAETFAAVSGADLVIVSTVSWGGATTGEGRYVESETEVVRLFAVDIEAVDFAQGPIVIERERSFERAPDLAFPDGNSASFDVAASAYADTSSASVEIQALSIEEQYSLVTALAEVYIA